MKNKIEKVSITADHKTFAEGCIEIDDQLHQISVIKLKKTIMGKKEELLIQLPYSAKDFPQFDEENTMIMRKYNVVVESEEDRRIITAILTQPFQDLEKQIDNNITKTEVAIKKMLLSRAQALDTLALLRKDPRKELFYNFPSILANYSEPITETVELQKNGISTALSQFANEMSTLDQEIQNSKEIMTQIQKFIIAVGTTQDAVFKGGEFELRTSLDIVKSLGLTAPSTTGLTIRKITELLLNEYVQRNHKNAVNSVLGLVHC